MQHARQINSISENIVDPVCGMQTESPEDYIPYDHAGTTHYFCSEHCLKKFKTDPERYLSADAGDEAGDSTDEDAGSAVAYTCPMHPEIRQEGPGDCPKCGMALELEQGYHIHCRSAALNNTVHKRVCQDQLSG